MRLVYDDTGAILRLVEDLLGVQMDAKPSVIAAVNEANEFVGAVVLTGYTGFDVDMTVVGPGSLTRGNIRAVLRHVFGHLNCMHLSAKTRRDNREVRRLLEKFGFKFIAPIPNHYGPRRRDDAFCYRLSREKAERWMKDGS